MTGAAPTLFFVAVAGAAGTLCRYLLGGWLARATGETFPWETLLINLSGCVAIGIVAGAVERGALIPPHVRVALMVGFLGGFTTFSSFALEAYRLASAGQEIAALGYVVLTNVLCLAGVWGAYQLVAPR